MGVSFYLRFFFYRVFLLSIIVGCRRVLSLYLGVLGSFEELWFLVVWRVKVGDRIMGACVVWEYVGVCVCGCERMCLWGCSCGC